ncbi:hypothetical protein HZA57_08100 [Candidatus Poribacteria bacterium]|nr:hypothetical protein [Candidatus Poribacteria bacterium]
MENPIETLIAFVVGLAVGVSINSILDALSKRDKRKAQVAAAAAAKAKSSGKTDQQAFESYVFYIDRYDYERGSTIGVESHLRDVVEEARSAGRVCHHLRLVLKGYDESRQPVMGNDELLTHCVLLHKKCPHLAYWLEDSSLELYLKLVHLGLQVSAEDGNKKAITSWSQLCDDIASRATHAIQHDLGGPEKVPDGLLTQLTGDGMHRIEAVVERLDPTRQVTLLDSIPAVKGKK